MNRLTRRQFIQGSALSLVSARRVAVACFAPIQQLQRHLHPQDGQLAFPRTAVYEARRPGFNLRTPAQPVAILTCFSTVAVQQAIAWAREYQVPLHLRSGGHSYEGFSNGSGLLLDLGQMNNFHIDAKRERVQVGAGVKQGPLRYALAQQGFVLAGGTCPTVGIAGLTLGGGYGLMSRLLGLTCDNLHALNIIDCLGKSIGVSEQAHPDLLWACRGGGGGQFGVVTDLSLKICSVQEAWTFRITWPPARMGEVLRSWQSWAPFIDHALTCRLEIQAEAGKGLTSVSANGMFLVQSTSRPASETDLHKLLRPLTSIGPNEVELHNNNIARCDAFSDYATPSVYFKAKSDFVTKSFTPDAIENLHHALTRLQSGWLVLLFSPGGGAIDHVSPSATAHAHRRSLFGIQYFSSWDNPAQTSAYLESIRNLYAQMRPFTNGGAYVNYIDADLPHWDAAYFGENLPGLRRVKATYDPDNFFRSGSQSLTPAK